MEKQFVVVGNDGDGKTCVISRVFDNHGEAMAAYRHFQRDWMPGNVQFWDYAVVTDLGLPEFGEAK